MIWTEEEDDLRQFDTLTNYKGQTCRDCQWCNWEKGKTFFTCGHHIQNFTPDSYCGYFTSKDDPKVKAYFERRKKELREKIESKRKQ